MCCNETSFTISMAVRYPFFRPARFILTRAPNKRFPLAPLYLITSMQLDWSIKASESLHSCQISSTQEQCPLVAQLQLHAIAPNDRSEFL